MTRGRYILIEGDEGAGKTAQTAALRQALATMGHPVEIVREPGGDPFAEALRQILKHADYAIPARAEALAFSAARASMLETVVRPLLDQGTWVISDRGYISTLIMQGVVMGLDSPDFRHMVEYAIEIAPPDLTLVLDITLDEAIKRQHQRGLPEDRFDRGHGFRRRVNQAYHDIKHPHLVHIDGHGPVEKITHRLITAITGNPTE